MPVRGKLTMPEKFAAQLIALGHSLTDVAQEAELSLPVLRRALTHPLMDAEVSKWRVRAFPVLVDRLSNRLEQLQEPALEQMADLLHAESEPVQFQAARDLLNRGPLAPSPGQHGPGGQGGMTISLDQAALQAILAGALNMGQHGIVAAFASLGTPPAPERPPLLPLP